MRQFAEQEIVFAEGPYAGLTWNADRQPVHGLWFDAVDSGYFNRFAFLGCGQFGKTLNGYVIPLLYHQFEVGEKTGVLLPTGDMAAEKWQEEIKPIIEKSRYWGQMPTTGAGSRGGGNLKSIRFENGTKMKFMSGRAGDTDRSGYTCRVGVATEIDKMDEASETSRETDPIRQLEARTESYATQKRIYLECTVSFEKGRIWQEYVRGSRSRILSPCVHCGEWVAPEREHFSGFEDAETQLEAGEKGAYCCPSCGQTYSDDQRKSMVRDSKLVHGTQTIDKSGESVGEMPKTRTLGFRATAFHNLFWTQGHIAEKCWARLHAEDEESAEKAISQFTFVVPYQQPKQDLTPLVIDEVIRRQSDYPEGQVPDDVEFLTLGCDVGKYRLHWALVGWSDLRPYEIEYGQVEIPTDSFGVERALGIGFAELWDKAFSVGWTNLKTGRKFTPATVWIDAQHWTEVVEAFCRKHAPIARACHGRGQSQYGSPHYARRTKTGKDEVYRGEGYHLQRNELAGLHEVQVNVDHWKSEVHRALETPRCELDRQSGQPTAKEARGSFLLHKAGVNDHRTYVKHLTAEKQVEDFVEGRGLVVVWKQIRKQNHWLDATMLSFAGGHFCGWTPNGIVRPEETPAPQPVSSSGLRMPDGRAWLITQRG